MHFDKNSNATGFSIHIVLTLKKRSIKQNIGRINKKIEKKIIN